MAKLFYLWVFVKEFISVKFLTANSRAGLEKRQLLLWEKLKHSALSKSDFYTSFINKPHSEWPILDKVTHMEAFNEINTVGLDKETVLLTAQQSEASRDFTPQLGDYSVGLSSGTSGNLGVFAASKTERTMWAANIFAKVLPLRLRKERIAFFLRANNKLYESVSSQIIQFQYFDLLIDIDAHIEHLNDYQPTVLIAPASVLSILADAKGKTLLISPSKVISVAEVLTDEDKYKIQTKFKQIVHQVYQCTEGFLAATCERGNLHLNEESVLFEKKWLDKELGIFSPIVTDLKRQTQPIIRYHLDDILVENKNQCECGQYTTRVDRILGRSDDVFYLKKVDGSEDKPLFPDFITRSVTQASSEISDFQVQQKANNRLVILLPIDQQVLFPQVVSSLKTALSQQGFVVPDMDFMPLKLRPLHVKNRRVQRCYQRA